MFIKDMELKTLDVADYSRFYFLLSASGRKEDCIVTFLFNLIRILSMASEALRRSSSSSDCAL